MYNILGVAGICSFKGARIMKIPVYWYGRDTHIYPVLVPLLLQIQYFLGHITTYPLVICYIAIENGP
jgi:hypothetical protein